MDSTSIIRKCYCEPIKHLHFVARQTKKEEFFVIITGDEKWIYFDNPKRRKSWVDPD